MNEQAKSSGGDILVRAALPDEGERIVAFNAAIAQETEGINLDPARLRRGVWSVLLDPNKGQYFVATRNGELCGQLMITYEWSDWRDGVIWWIQSVYVAPRHRRQGVLRALLGHVRRTAERRPDVCGLRVYVEHNNEIARAAYLKLGLTASIYLMYENDFVLNRHDTHLIDPHAGLTTSQGTA
jgi:ribosomal protein S18 acetylase RimI-like enzyme